MTISYLKWLAMTVRTWAIDMMIFFSLTECAVASSSSSHEWNSVTCHSAGANAALQMATSLMQLTLSHFTRFNSFTASLNVRSPGGELVRGIYTKMKGKMKEARRIIIWQVYYEGWRLVSNTIEEWLVSLNQQWPATAAEEMRTSVLRFC